MSRGICVFYVAVHISLRIRVSLLEEHKSLGICVSLLGKDILLGICLSWVGEHISLGICVSLLGEKISLIKGQFPTFFFLGNIGHSNVFYDIPEQKKPILYSTKTRSSKAEKIDIFLKRLVHGFGPKLAIFPTFFLRQYRPGKCVLRYSGKNKQLFRLYKQEFKKVEKLTFFQRGYYK